MKETILKFANLLKASQDKRDKRFKEFHEFHKWGLENIPSNLWRYIPSITDICFNYAGHGMEMSVSDYNWWCAEYNQKPYILMKDVKVIQQKYVDALAKQLSLLKFDDEDSKNAITEILALIDGSYAK